ncbi:hypothetical protein ACOME3_007989 [Neoechinorhynchus agilis]
MEYMEVSRIMTRAEQNILPNVSDHMSCSVDEIFRAIIGSRTLLVLYDNLPIDRAPQTKCMIEFDIIDKDIVQFTWSIVEVSQSAVSRVSNVTLNNDLLNSDVIREAEEKYRHKYQECLKFVHDSQSQNTFPIENDVQLLDDLDFGSETNESLTPSGTTENLDGTNAPIFQCPYFKDLKYEPKCEDALVTMQLWEKPESKTKIPTAYSFLAPLSTNPSRYEWYDFAGILESRTIKTNTDWSFFCTDRADESSMVKYVKNLVKDYRDEEYTRMVDSGKDFKWYKSVCSIGLGSNYYEKIRHFLGNDFKYNALMDAAKLRQGIAQVEKEDKRATTYQQPPLTLMIPQFTVFAVSSIPCFTGDGIYCSTNGQGILAGFVQIHKEMEVDVAQNKNCTPRKLTSSGSTLICCSTEFDLFQKLEFLVNRFDPDVLVCYDKRDLTHICQRAQSAIWSRLIHQNNLDSFQGRYILELWSYLRSNASDHLDTGLRSYSFEAACKALLDEMHCELNNQQLIEIYSKKGWIRNCLNYIEQRAYTYVRMLDRTKVLESSSELARIFGIEIQMVHCRGSQYRVESLLARTCHPLGYVCPNLLFFDQQAPVAIPLNLEPCNDPPLKGDPTVVLDFRSLYPSIICAYNICFSTCMGCVDNFGTGILGRIKDYVPPRHHFPHIRQGILPQILEKLLSARRLVKAKIPKTDEEKKRLHWRQLGLKLLANVIYGYTAAHFSGRMSCVDVADSIVHFGRYHMISAANLIRSKSLYVRPIEVVYGDTDSLFLRFSKWPTVEEAAKMGKYLSSLVTASCPEPMKFEYEKIYAPCALLEKKRYAGLRYDFEDLTKSELECKGIEVVRRDGCVLASNLLKIALCVLFRTRDISRVRKTVLFETDMKLCPSEYKHRNYTQFLISREYRNSYRCAPKYRCWNSF